jgi:hypothetical protein
MKTIRFILAGFVLSFSFLACQKDNIEPQSPSSLSGTEKSRPDENLGAAPFSAPPFVTFQVTIHVSVPLPVCNIFQVEISDAEGNLVVPAQTYLPGVTVYDFHESGLVSGVRIAKLVLAPNTYHLVCTNTVYANPDVMVMDKTFLHGETYYFDLFPIIVENKSIE